MRSTRESEGYHREILAREIGIDKGRAGKVRKIIGFDLLGRESGRCYIAPELERVPPFALDFSRTNVQAGRWIAVADEEGYVTRLDVSDRVLGDHPGEGEGLLHKRSQFLAHPNAIFDIQWTDDDSKLLTGSGDQSIKLWDAETEQGIVSFRGHGGSIKSIACRKDGSGDVFVSGSRDGAIMLWDRRNGKHGSCRLTGETFCKPISVIPQAHGLPRSAKARRTYRGRPTKGTVQSSVTSVLYLRDEGVLASSGAADGVVKLWDIRNLKGPSSLISILPGNLDACPNTRKFGITCLSTDRSGSKLLVSCSNDTIYLYDVLRPDSPPLGTFTGHTVQGFYVKADISPDGCHIVSGSNDSNVYIWHTDKPHEKPCIMRGHEGEVTAVKWSPTDPGLVATCADDFSTRVWSISQNLRCNSRKPLQVTTRHNVQAPCTPPVHSRSACAPTPLHPPGPSRLGEEQADGIGTREGRKRQLALDQFFLR